MRASCSSTHATSSVRTNGNSIMNMMLSGERVLPRKSFGLRLRKPLGRLRRKFAESDQRVGERPVEGAHDQVGLVGGGDGHELQKRRPADEVLRALLVLESRQLDDDTIVALALDRRLGNTELVDPVADDFESPVHGVLGLVRRQPLLVHLKNQVHSALQVQSQLQRLVLQSLDLLRPHPGLLLVGERQEAERV